MSTYEGPTGICAICQKRVAAEFLLQHPSVVHGIDATSAEWPDGGPVIVDLTLTPEDFEERTS